MAEYDFNVGPNYARYVKVTPEGQFDQYACWAACLAWWLRAVEGGRKKMTQSQIIVKFNGLADADTGGMSNNALLQVYNNSELRITGAFFDAKRFKTQRFPIGDRPVILGGTTPSGGNHLNVIYSQDEAARTAFVMEPAWPPGADNNKRTGTHDARGFDWYLNGSQILLAWASD